MAYWELGVSVPVPNHSFRFGSYKETKLNAAYTSGLTLAVTTDLRQFFGSGNYVVVGPNGSGVSETGKITSVASDEIQISSSLSYDYVTNNVVSGIGDQLAAAWTTLESYGSGNVTEGIELGYNDNSSQRWKVNSVNDPASIINYLDDDVFLASTVYRAGGYYKFTDTSGDAVYKIQVNDGNANFLGGTLTSSTVSDWTLHTTTATSTSGAGGSGAYIRFYLDPTSSSVATAWIDHAFVEHASDTDDAASGYYTFTEYPEQGSIQWTRMDSLINVRMRNFQKKIYDSSGSEGRQALHLVSAEFENVSSTFAKNLRILLEWQNKGNYLVLHHDIPEIPPVLVGVMRLDNMRHIMWDKTKETFRLTFEECV